jgi:DNA-binding Xre family transcriptional regulator
LGRVGHGGRGAYVVTPTLVRAVRAESVAAICHWLGVGTTTVGHWRRALGVDQLNDGTRALYSLWKRSKLPDAAVAFSPAALRRTRLRRGLTQRQVATRMGWRSISAYEQMESGRRRRATPHTLRRLAAALRCRTSGLVLRRRR